MYVVDIFYIVVTQEKDGRWSVFSQKIFSDSNGVNNGVNILWLCGFFKVKKIICKLFYQRYTRIIKKKQFNLFNHLTKTHVYLW